MNEQRTCPSCGEPVGDTDTTCPNCAAELPPVDLPPGAVAGPGTHWYHPPARAPK